MDELTKMSGDSFVGHEINSGRLRPGTQAGPLMAEVHRGRQGRRFAIIPTFGGVLDCKTGWVYLLPRGVSPTMRNAHDFAMELEYSF